MKAEITIEFLKINGIEVNNELLNSTPQLIASTENALKKICTAFEKHFQSKDIKVKVSFKRVIK